MAGLDTKENVCAVLHGPLDIRMTKSDIPIPDDNGLYIRSTAKVIYGGEKLTKKEKPEVLLSMGSVGICGSDIKYWKYGQCGVFRLNAPMVMGHEGSGTVVSTGPGVKNLKIGDRVAIEPGVPCRKCRLCKEGRYNLCPDIYFCATPPDDGMLRTYYKHPADFCFKLPDHVSLDEGALMEPLAVAIYSCRRGNVCLGTTILVCGAGPVGILTMIAAKEMGATSVLITDIDEYRLSKAKEFGADYIYNVKVNDPAEVAAEIVGIMGCQPDVSFECSGTDFSIATAIHATFPGGSVVTVGRGTDKGGLPLNKAASKEVDIKGIFRYANCYPAALEIVSKFGTKLRKLVTHHFNMTDTEKAFETAISRTAKAVKVIIQCNVDA